MGSYSEEYREFMVRLEARRPKPSIQEASLTVLNYLAHRVGIASPFVTLNELDIALPILLLELEMGQRHAIREARANAREEALAALKPFAAIPDVLIWPDEYQQTIYLVEKGGLFTVGDLRRARDLYRKLRDET